MVDKGMANNKWKKKRRKKLQKKKESLKRTPMNTNHRIIDS